MVKLLKSSLVFFLLVFHWEPSVVGLNKDSIRMTIPGSYEKRGPRIYPRAGHHTSSSSPTEGVVKKHCLCSKVYDPVCASNGKSYYNQCHMQCEGGSESLTIIHQGNCIPY